MVVISHRQTLLSSCCLLIASALADFCFGHLRQFGRPPVTSGIPPETDTVRAGRHVSKVPILLRKSFWGGERKFLGPLMRFMRGNVRDHIVSSKIDHEPPQWR
jgi:hypothetical protein